MLKRVLPNMKYDRTNDFLLLCLIILVLEKNLYLIIILLIVRYDINSEV